MKRTARLLGNAAIGGFAVVIALSPAAAATVSSSSSLMSASAFAFSSTPQRRNERATTTATPGRRRSQPISLDDATAPDFFVARLGTTTLLRAIDPSSSSHESAVSVSTALLSLSSSLPPLVSDLFSSSGNVPLLSSLALNSVLFFSLRPKLNTMLTPEGFAHSLALGTMLWTTLGWRGWTVCVLYLFLGQLVTKVGFAEKEALGIAEGRGGRRGPENVWGSALTGTICAAAAAHALKSSVGGGVGVGGDFLGLGPDVWILGYVASLATKLADTFASEIGKAYGKTTFLITTLERVPPGTEGAVSLEGTLASVVGGLALSAYAYLAVGLIPTLGGLGVATFAAFFATMCESLIGATLQDAEGSGGWMTNEVVNFFNTLIGAATAMVLGVAALGM